MQVATKLNNIVTNTNVTVNVVVLNINTKGKQEYAYQVLGTTLSNWTSNAFGDYPVSYLEFDSSVDMLKFISSHTQGTTYTVFVNSNMPLLTADNARKLVEYAVFKQINLCKFTGGYVANNVYLRQTNAPICDSVYSYDMDNYYIVENKKQLGYIAKVLQQRIFDYHLQNGVTIMSEKGLTVEPDVEIAQGVIVYGGNILKGHTFVGKNTILKENNVIENSVVGNNCGISGSVIDNSKIGDDTYVMPFCNIDNSVIGNNCTIKSYVQLTNQKIKNGVVLSPAGDVEDK